METKNPDSFVLNELRDLCYKLTIWYLHMVMVEVVSPYSGTAVLTFKLLVHGTTLSIQLQL